MTSDIRVDGARLWDSIMAMAQIGATLIQTLVDGIVSWQLFDLQADPYEQLNLIDEPGYAPQIKQLKQNLRLRQTRSNDPLITEAKTDPPNTR